MSASLVVTSIGRWLADSAAKLGSSSASPQVDAEYLLAAVLNKDRSYFFTWPDAPLSERDLAALNGLLNRRLKGEPVAHILGEREFWSLCLYCDSSTLIPRPDTEALVEGILDLALPKKARILDLGTGTGAIALALASERADFEIDAVDVSAAAVALAIKNRQRHGLGQVNIFTSDWFSKVTGRYDLVVSNPPYIDEADHHLLTGDLRFEPHTALVAADKGLADIRAIIQQAPLYLQPGARVLVEHGWQQKVAVQALFRLAAYRHIETWRDFGGNDRATIARVADPVAGESSADE